MKKEKVKDIIQNIYYVEDPRTGICFAFFTRYVYLVHEGHYESGLAVVPREAIPADLLHVVDLA